MLLALVACGTALLRGRDEAALARDATRFEGAGAVFVFDEAAGRLTARVAEVGPPLEVDLSLVVDGLERPVLVGVGGLTAVSARASRASLPVALDDERLGATLELHADERGDALTVRVSLPPSRRPRRYGLRASFPENGRGLFVPGAGGVVAHRETDTSVALVDDELASFALVAPAGGGASADTPDGAREDAGPRARFTAKAKEDPSGDGTTLELRVLAARSPPWAEVYAALGVPHARVRGVVHGAGGRAHVTGLDADGRPRLRVLTGEGGRFEVDAEPSTVLWVASGAASATGAPVRFAPGSAWELLLDVSPGGEIHARVIDEDGGRPLVARLHVHGLAGTQDPTFGPDFRASGAGPLMDLAHGEVTTPVPAGRYRVSATKGLEWSIDAKEITVASGGRADVELRLRHVVPTPRLVGCDLHVHARPSFDSPVTPEDRVLSLVSAGVDFAVPSEHDMVGDYAPALALLGLGKELAFVPGVEMTTDMPRFGHFGVFPYPLDRPPPRTRGTNATRLLAAARRGDPGRVVQINHPRMEGGIGYFAVSGYDAGAGKLPQGMRADFDTLEVYNGFDLDRRERVEQTMVDWFSLLDLGHRIAATGSSDSHRIQYHWAGYPRTYALLDARAAGDDGGPVDVKAIAQAVARGRSFVTSGPILELSLEAGGRRAGPGEELTRPEGGRVRATLRVLAAPWVDVRSLEILAGGPATRGPGSGPLRASPYVAQLPEVPSRTGREEGTLDEAIARSVRSAQELTLDLPEGTSWVVAIVRGERPLDDVLPFMPVQPLAFTNPVWITNR